MGSENAELFGKAPPYAFFCSRLINLVPKDINMEFCIKVFRYVGFVFFNAHLLKKSAVETKLCLCMCVNCIEVSYLMRILAKVHRCTLWNLNSHLTTGE